MDEEPLFRFLLGQATPTEREAVTAWRNASQEHEARLAELTYLLELAGEADVQVPTGDPPSAAEIIQLARGRAGIITWRRWLQRFGVGLAAAAVALVAVGLLSTDRSDSAGYVFGADEFVTGAKETATVRLGDGSVVRLAPASRLRVIPSRNERVVSLEGRGYFAVVKVEGRPFEVRTRAGAVSVLGTRFDLEANADTLALIVVEGRVALSIRGQQATLESGERSGIKNGRLLPPAKVDDVARSVAWTGNFLVFQATPLAKVASEIAEHYGVRVEIPDPALASRTVTAWLSEQSLDEALNIVCTIVGAQCLVRDRTVIMRPQ